MFLNFKKNQEFPDMTIKRLLPRQPASNKLAFLVVCAAFTLAGCGGSSTEPATVAAAPTELAAPILRVSTIKQLDMSWPVLPGATAIEVLQDPDGEGPLPEGRVAELAGSATGHSLEIFLPTALAARWRLRVCQGSNCGHSAQAWLGGNLAQAVGYLKADTPSRGFGSAVALSRDGQTMAVGARGQFDDAIPTNGEVFVYRRAGSGSWALEATLTAPNGEPLDQFGSALALSADGSVLTVSAPQEDGSAASDGGVNDDNNAVDAGAVYVFERASAVWSSTAYLKGSALFDADQMGTSLDVSDDGRTLVASGQGRGPHVAQSYFPGVVYVFEKNLAGGWAESAVLKAPLRGPDQTFLSQVSISGDGNTIAVGDHEDSSSGAGVFNAPAVDSGLPRSGAVYLFARSGFGWALEAYIKAGNSHQDQTFGSSVDLSFDGATLAVGAMSDAGDRTGLVGDPAFAFSGAAFVFHRSAAAWVQTAYLKSKQIHEFDSIGSSVALSSDATALVVAAQDDQWAGAGVGDDARSVSSRFSGAVHVFRRDAQDWSSGTYVKASNTRSGDNFGFSIAISGDGRLMAVGSFKQGDDAAGFGADPTAFSGRAPGSGAVYLY